MADFY
jgi:hypothetical protein